MDEQDASGGGELYPTTGAVEPAANSVREVTIPHAAVARDANIERIETLGCVCVVWPQRRQCCKIGKHSDYKKYLE